METSLKEATEIAPIIYKHGYSDEQVDKIKEGKRTIDARDKLKHPPSLKEFREIIVPWNRIHRVEQFNLHPVKVQGVKKARAKSKVSTLSRKTVPKAKKLTKKQINDKIGEIVFKIAMKTELSKEEKSFYSEHTNTEELL